ncbi:MAG TPA: ASCH domain-containing protein [Chryseolinea sp.]|nr:ASCH domain-containing protein [Chryseolinea sp.]HPM29566.1 ASCH domain-containing protein [Chryseolinea sp.]
MKKYLFISVKHEYANKILEGTKTIELRKSKPKVSKGDFVIIYSTTPVKAIIGIAEVDDLISCPPDSMWRLHSKKLGIKHKDFLDYYSNSETSIGIVLSNPKKYRSAISLSSIKRDHPEFQPPQTYRYFMDFQPSKSPLFISY